MKTILSLGVALGLSAGVASAQLLMLDFGPTTATGADRSLSPGHATGAIPATDLAWNTITSSAAVDSLVFANGDEATGISLTMGQESSAGSGTISYSTAISNTGLAGSGGSTTGQQSLVGDSGSIYAGTAPGRDAFFGGTGSAIGLRIDGLAVGEYVVFVMARNTNSNAIGGNPSDVYVSTGASAGTFQFDLLTPTNESNATYPNSNPTAYNAFVGGENYVAINFNIGVGDSLFLAIDGASATELRGFMNMVQIAAVPEPAEYALAIVAGLGVLAFVRRRRAVHSNR